MEIIHVSAECYPMAKAGGLGDVVGALPKYQNELGHNAKVVMPMYKTKFLFEHSFQVVHKGAFGMGAYYLEYTIIKQETNTLGFELYLVDIYGLLDREKVYGYDDDTERFLAFQIAVVDWMSQWQHRPDVVHVHDHHAGLVPFMMKNCFAYNHLAGIRTILTIHNGQYQGWMDWAKSTYLPNWDKFKWGQLDWKKNINPLACAIRTVDKVTTVSPGYLQELFYNANGLEDLFEYEKGKCVGILNGIDTEVWNPENDPYLDTHYNTKTAKKGKDILKKKLCQEFNLDPTKPLIVFIGRLVGEKAADLLPDALNDVLYHLPTEMSILILGSGEPAIESQLERLNSRYLGYYNSRIGYNEKLSHEMYAGADFLLMPSRVEPCGLNQLYALRYGTIPIVRNTGGLKDTVKDFGEPGGFGICFNQASIWDISSSIGRAIGLYFDKAKIDSLRKTIMEIDHSWTKSAKMYLEIYNG